MLWLDCFIRRWNRNLLAIDGWTFDRVSIFWEMCLKNRCFWHPNLGMGVYRDFTVLDILKDICADSMTFINPIYFSYKNNTTHFATLLYKNISLKKRRFLIILLKSTYEKIQMNFKLAIHLICNLSLWNIMEKNSVFTNLHIYIRIMSSWINEKCHRNWF